jgi:adenosylcobinamide-phosphate synthase
VRRTRLSIFLSAALLDAAMGDPEWLPHPVRAIGWATEFLESTLRPRLRGRADEIIAGAALTLTVVAGSIFLSREGVAFVQKRNARAGFALEAILAASCVALRNLLEEASATVRLLESGKIEKARLQLARIVGRDTSELSSPEMSRAVIETLAESLSDGVIAPLLYLALGGVPLAMGYKAVNTLDSMIGHRSERYLYFGRAAARLDDVANFVPSRLSALMISLASAILPGASAPRALQTWLGDGGKHASPNAGQPEAAMAGALGVRLGGANIYDGEVVESPVMGKLGGPASVAHARRALRVTAVAGLMAAGLFAWFLRRGARA